MSGRSDKHAAGRRVGMRAAALKHMIHKLPAGPGCAGAAFPTSAGANGLKMLISGWGPS